jgi:hypothetical protein
MGNHTGEMGVFQAARGLCVPTVCPECTERRSDRSTGRSDAAKETGVSCLGLRVSGLGLRASGFGPRPPTATCLVEGSLQLGSITRLGKRSRCYRRAVWGGAGGTHFGLSRRAQRDGWLRIR